MKRYPQWNKTIVVVVGLCLILIGNVAVPNSPLQIGDRIPDHQLLSIEGMSVSLRPPEGKYLFIQFWDIHSAQTREIVTSVNLIYKRFHDSGLNAIGICTNASEDEVIDFANSEQILWPQVLDRQDNIKITEKYILTETPFNFIIDSEGKVLAIQLIGTESHETIGMIIGVSLNDLPLEKIKKNWKENFYALYRLENDEVLKRIPAPFIPERQEYYITEHKSQSEAIPHGPSSMVFHWDGKLKNWGMSFGGSDTPLSHVLTFPLGLASFEFDGSDDLLKINVNGDWIVRIPSTAEERILALEKIIRKELEEPISFELQEVERDVVVASGEYAYHPLEGFEKDDRFDTVHVFTGSGQIQEGGGGGGMGTLKEFLRSFGSLYKIHIIDETRPSEVTFSYRWRKQTPVHSENLRNRMNQSLYPSDSESLDGYLETIGKQTSIQFRKERRKVSVWIIVRSED